MYQFTQDCLTGIQQIDEEHCHLFELINEAMELLQGDMLTDKYHEIDALMKDLRDYVDTHFEHEEAYMESINDPELPLQRKQHNQFRDKINMLDLAAKNSIQEQKEILEETLLYLVKWLYHHILGSDVMIGKMQILQKEENPYAFTEKYFTGIEVIDTEHRRLFEIIEEANTLIKTEFLHDKYDEIVEIIEELREYTKVHFRDEEEYMEKIQYPDLPIQKRAHEGFIEKLYEVNLEDIDEHQQEYLVDLTEYLLKWLINHIMKLDKKIGEESRKEC